MNNEEAIELSHYPGGQPHRKVILKWFMMIYDDDMMITDQGVNLTEWWGYLNDKTIWLTKRPASQIGDSKTISEGMIIFRQ